MLHDLGHFSGKLAEVLLLGGIEFKFARHALGDKLDLFFRRHAPVIVLAVGIDGTGTTGNHKGSDNNTF